MQRMESLREFHVGAVGNLSMQGTPTYCLLGKHRFTGLFCNNVTVTVTDINNAYPRTIDGCLFAPEKFKKTKSATLGKSTPI
jgi:hypothetical protein